MHYKIKKIIILLLPFILLLIIWSIISGILKKDQIPYPWEVFIELILSFSGKEIYSGIKSTLGRTLISFFISAAIGTLIGSFMSTLPKIQKGLEAIVDFLRSIPAPALLPIFMVFFGIFTGPKIALAVFGCGLINIVYTYYGIRQESISVRTEMLKVINAPSWFIYTRVVFPGAIENIFTGLRVTLSLSLVLSTLAEYVLQTGNGVGVLIRINYEDGEYIYMYALILLLGILGYALNRIFQFIEVIVIKKRHPGKKLDYFKFKL